MAEIAIGFSNMRAVQFHVGVGATSCACGCEAICCNPLPKAAMIGPVTCQSANHSYNRTSALWEQSLCPKPDGANWHNLACIQGGCNHCGVQLIPLCASELDSANQKTLAWRRFEMVLAGTTKKGIQKKVVRLEYKQTIAKAFLEFALPKIPLFVQHQHNARWQDVMYKDCLAGLQKGEVMSLIDFAENYSFKGQNEIQSMHWYNFQLTILVHITYSVNLEYNRLDPQSKRLLTAYHYYISDDRVHDSLFVQHYLLKHWEELKLAGNTPARHIVWSDGCAAQFKGATAWFFVSRYPSLTTSEDLPSGCKMDWHFWGTGHGKGPHDGAGACLKQTLRKEQIKPDSVRLHNAADVVTFLKVAMNLPNGAYPRAKRVLERHFHLIGKREVCRKSPLSCRTVPGSRSMHSIWSVNNTNNVLLECRDYSCFCNAFVTVRAPERCLNYWHVAPWKLVTLDPRRADEAVQQEEDLDQEWTAAPDSNLLASELVVGDRFAILADRDDPSANGAKFFILVCTKPMYVVEEEMVEDAWGGSMEQGDEAVEGLYYEQQGIAENSYIFLGFAGVARIYSHLVCPHKFSMTLAKHKQKGKTNVYQLSQAALEKIDAIMQSREFGDDLLSEGEDNCFDMDQALSDSSDASSNSDSM